MLVYFSVYIDVTLGRTLVFFTLCNGRLVIYVERGRGRGLLVLWGHYKRHRNITAQGNLRSHNVLQVRAIIL